MCVCAGDLLAARRFAKLCDIMRNDLENLKTLCPETGQLGFAALTIRYIPAKRLVESKSQYLNFADRHGWTKASDARVPAE